MQTFCLTMLMAYLFKFCLIEKLKRLNLTFFRYGGLPNTAYDSPDHVKQAQNDIRDTLNKMQHQGYIERQRQRYPRRKEFKWR